MTEPFKYTIILDEDVRVDPRRHAPAVAAAMMIPMTEAKLLVRKARGIYLENLTADQARAVSADLSQAGIRNWAKATKTLPQLPKPHKVMHLEDAEDIFTYWRSNEVSNEAMAWEDIIAVSCGAVVTEAHRDLFSDVPFELVPPLHKLDDEESRNTLKEKLVDMTSNKPALRTTPHGSLELLLEEIESKYAGKIVMYVDIIGRYLTDRLRIKMDEFAFAQSARARKVGGSWGFRFFLQVVQMRARTPALTPVTNNCLQGNALSDVLFLSIEEFNRYTTWFIQRLHCLEQPGPKPTP